MAKWLTGILVAALTSGLLYASYRLTSAYVAEDVYRARLEELDARYGELREQYNAAVRKTAVTELLVEDGKLSVVVSTAAGDLSRVDTPFDPAQEIHVDFIVLEGRLWIRRVYDDRTPANQGVMVDPKLIDVSWDDDGEVYGLSVYRPLSEGRWVVTATQQGALGLSKRASESSAGLVHAPKVVDLKPLDELIEQDVSQIGVLDVVQSLTR